MLKIATVEDDANFAAKLKSYIEKYSQKYNINYNCDSYKNGLELLQNKPVYDIIFMDIKMPHLNGMETAKKLREWDKNCALIFVTNMAQYAIKGYEVNALDFILKPLEYYEFEIKLKKAIDYYQKHKNVKINIDLGNMIKRVSIEDIYYIEVMDHLLMYHIKDDIFETYGKLKQIEKQFQLNNFVRCHQSYLVNLKHVMEVHGDYIIVNTDKIPVSRRKKKKFMKRFTDYMGGGF